MTAIFPLELELTEGESLGTTNTSTLGTRFTISGLSSTVFVPRRSAMGATRCASFSAVSRASQTSWPSPQYPPPEASIVLTPKRRSGTVVSSSPGRILNCVRPLVGEVEQPASRTAQKSGTAMRG